MVPGGWPDSSRLGGPSTTASRSYCSRLSMILHYWLPPRKESHELYGIPIRNLRASNWERRVLTRGGEKMGGSGEEDYTCRPTTSPASATHWSFRITVSMNQDFCPPVCFLPALPPEL